MHLVVPGWKSSMALSIEVWLPTRGSNPEPPDPESGALPIELVGNVYSAYHACPGSSRSEAALRRFLDLRPGVAQGGGAVEDKLVGGRIRVHAEIALALKLISSARCSPGNTRFDPARLYFQRVGIQVVHEAAARLDIVRVRLDKQMVI